MRFNISKDELATIFNIVSKGMSSRSTLPILSGILIDATEGKVTFQTTDLEISIRHTAPADVEQPGRTVVPGKLFGDIVKSLPDAAVCVSTDGELATISCLETSFTLSTLNPVDFPYFPAVETTRSVTIPAPDLATAVKKVGKAVSRDEARAILTGILFSVDGPDIRLVATDSYRLSVADLEVEGQDADPFDAIIPGRIFEDVTRIAAAGEAITVSFSENQIVFTFGETTLVSRKIEGTYPNYRQLLPKDHATSIRVETAALITAVKRVSLLAQAHTPVRLSFSADEGNITVSSRTQDVGGAREVLAAEVDGENMEIAFNHQYILDGLSCVGDECVIELQTSLKPGIIKPAKGNDFVYLAMPVRLA